MTNIEVLTKLFNWWGEKREESHVEERAEALLTLLALGDEQSEAESIVVLDWSKACVMFWTMASGLNQLAGGHNELCTRLNQIAAEGTVDMTEEEQ